MRKIEEAGAGGTASSLEDANEQDGYTPSDSPTQEPFASPYGLALQQFDWGHPNDLQTEWLVSQGVSFEALLKPWPTGATRVRFEGNYFVSDSAGVNGLTFVAFDRGVPIDIVAWQPKTGELATYLGRAVFLGDEDDAFNPATWFNDGDLLIHASPMDWLRTNREGVVILDELRAGEILRHVRSVRCSDDEMAATVHRRLQPARTSTRIFVSAPKEVAA